MGVEFGSLIAHWCACSVWLVAVLIAFMHSNEQAAESKGKGKARAGIEDKSLLHQVGCGVGALGRAYAFDTEPAEVQLRCS